MIVKSSLPDQFLTTARKCSLILSSANLQDSQTYFGSMCGIFKCWIMSCHEAPVPTEDNSKRKSISGWCKHWMISACHIQMGRSGDFKTQGAGQIGKPAMVCQLLILIRFITLFFLGHWNNQARHGEQLSLEQLGVKKLSAKWGPKCLNSNQKLYQVIQIELATFSVI